MVYGRDNRRRLIREIEKNRESKVICYVTGDRPSQGMNVPSLASQIGSDVVRYFRDLLQEIGHQENIDLFLYSRGGEITAPPPIVH